MAKTTSIRLTEGRRAKLRQLAKALGITPNATVGLLIDNGQIAVVTRHEAVATLTSGQTKNNGCDASVYQSQSTTAIAA